jgi:hypothetical protein
VTESTTWEGLHRLFAKIPYTMTNKQPNSLVAQVGADQCDWLAR